MIISWARKAQQNGLSLLPVADDPFALPIRPNSDPIRGPIFVQMDTSFLKSPKFGSDLKESSDSSNNTVTNSDEEESMFAKFDKSTWENRNFLFREEIAKKFGYYIPELKELINIAKNKHYLMLEIKSSFSKEHFC